MCHDTPLGPHGQRPAPPRNTRTADGILAGIFDLHHYAPVPFQHPIDWSADPHDNTWRWSLHSFQYLYDLVNTAESDTDLIHRKDVALRIIRDWWEANRDAELSPYSWRGHCVGLRAQLIGYLNLEVTDWLEALISRHAEMLLDEKTYEHGHNHGLDQDLGLLALAGTIPNDHWIDVATQRLASSAAYMVDEQGATAEQSVGYSYYVFSQLRQIEKAIRNHGRKVPSEILAYRSIPSFLNHATQPDTKYVPIGDTGSYRAFNIGYETEWCATGGVKGQVPAETHRVFDRGWIFGRSGWGTVRPFRDETYYSIRFGPGKAEDHGHVDNTSITYYAKQKPLIVDAGFAGYGDKLAHAYEKNELGHNMVLLSSAPPASYSRGHATDLVATTYTQHHKAYTLRDEPYPGVRRSRSVVYIVGLEALFVYDVILADGLRTAVQRWHVNPLVKSMTGLADHLYSADIDGVQLCIQQLLPVQTRTEITGSTDPVDGWIAESAGVRSPSPIVEFSATDINPRFGTLISTGECSAVCAGQKVIIYSQGVAHTSITIDLAGHLVAQNISTNS